MHEVSLVEELVEMCSARAAGRRVSLVRVRHATTLPEAALRQAFEMLTQDGPLAGAALEMEPIAVYVECACGFRGELGHDDVIGGSVVVCPSCGSVSKRRDSAELELLELHTASVSSG